MAEPALQRGKSETSDSGKRPSTSKRKSVLYFPILNALRFVLAFWVAVGHFEMLPLFGDPNTGTGLWHLFKRGWSTVVFGTPAVIVFFVISGFCIHLPFPSCSCGQQKPGHAIHVMQAVGEVGASTRSYALTFGGWGVVCVLAHVGG